MKSTAQILFIYNAGSGFFETISDFAHKIISPKTYSCSLCAITYGTTSMKKEWKNYLEELPFNTAFYHKDEISKVGISTETPLPAIAFKSAEGHLKILLSSEEINGIDSLEGLIHRMKSRISRLKA